MNSEALKEMESMGYERASRVEEEILSKFK